MGFLPLELILIGHKLKILSFKTLQVSSKSTFSSDTLFVLCLGIGIDLLHKTGWVTAHVSQLP